MRAPGVFFLSLALCLASAPTVSVEAHGGGLNSEGCHNDRKRGGYHCHRGGSARSDLSEASRGGSTGGAFRNCTAARAAGAAPVRRGDAGYGSHLDRDNDGVGCE